TADPPDPPRWDTRHKRIVGHVARHHSASRNERPSPDHASGQDDGPGSQRRPLADDHPDGVPVVGSLELARHVHRTRIPVIREPRGGPDKPAVLKPGRLVDESIVLQLHVVANGHAWPDIRTPAYDAGPAQARVLPYLGQMPYCRARPERGSLVHVGRPVHGQVVQVVHSQPPWSQGCRRLTISISAVARKMSLAPVASSETDSLSNVVFTRVSTVSSPLGLRIMAIRQSAAPLASSARALVYRVCIAGSGILGPASAVAALAASWAQAYLIVQYCRMPPACKALPNQRDTAARSLPPGPDCQLTAACRMRDGRLSAPPSSATLAAEMTLPFALVMPAGALLAAMPPLVAVPGAGPTDGPLNLVRSVPVPTSTAIK